MNAIRSTMLSLTISTRPLIWLTQINVDNTKHRAPFDARIGQGLFSTK